MAAQTKNTILPNDPITGEPGPDIFREYVYPGFSGIFGGSNFLPYLEASILSEVSGIYPLDPNIHAILTPLRVSKVLVYPLAWPLLFNIGDGRLKHLARFLFCDKVSSVGGAQQPTLGVGTARFGSTHTIPFPTSITNDWSSLTLTTSELANQPLTRLIYYWVTGMRDAHTGYFHGYGQIPEALLAMGHPRIYSADFIIAFMGPSGSAYDVQRAFMMLGAFPNEIPNLIETASNRESYDEIPDHAVTMNGKVTECTAVTTLAKMIVGAAMLRADETMVPGPRGFYSTFNNMTPEERVKMWNQNILETVGKVYADPEFIKKHQKMVSENFKSQGGDFALNPNDFGFPSAGNAMDQMPKNPGTT